MYKKVWIVGYKGSINTALIERATPGCIVYLDDIWDLISTVKEDNLQKNNMKFESEIYKFLIQIGIPHISAWLFLVALNQIVAISVSAYPRRNIYSSAVLLGIISLFIPFYIAAALLLVLFIIVFKTPTFLDILAVILGFALPFTTSLK